jgi:hypothetical protein
MAMTGIGLGQLLSLQAVADFAAAASAFDLPGQNVFPNLSWQSIFGAACVTDQVKNCVCFGKKMLSI